MKICFRSIDDLVEFIYVEGICDNAPANDTYARDFCSNVCDACEEDEDGKKTIHIVTFYIDGVEIDGDDFFTKIKAFGNHYKSLAKNNAIESYLGYDSIFKDEVIEFLNSLIYRSDVPSKITGNITAIANGFPLNLNATVANVYGQYQNIDVNEIADIKEDLEIDIRHFIDGLVNDRLNTYFWGISE